MSKKAKSPSRPSASQLRARLVSIARKAGAHGVSYETTEGACKVWISGIGIRQLVKSLREASVQIECSNVSGLTVFGNGFEACGLSASEIEKHALPAVFIACYRTNASGEDYAIGKDC